MHKKYNYDESYKLDADKIFKGFMEELEKLKHHRCDTVRVLLVALNNRKIKESEVTGEYYAGFNSGLDKAIEVLNEYLLYLGNTKQDETSDQ